MMLNKLCWFVCMIGMIGLNNNTLALTELDCVIEPQSVVEITSATAGLLESILIERGEHVKKGQLLAQLYSEVEKVNVKLAKIRATSKANILEKKARYQLSERTQARIEELFKKNAIAEKDRDEVQTRTLVAKYELENAKVNYQLAQLELKRTEEVLKLRSILSPIDGVVVEVIKSSGEYVHVVDEQPILKLAKVDLLYVEVIVPVSLFGMIKPGMSASVVVEEPIGGEYVAKVVIVDPIVDAASGTFGIRLHLQNKDYAIPAGLRCRIGDWL